MQIKGNRYTSGGSCRIKMLEALGNGVRLLCGQKFRTIEDCKQYAITLFPEARRVDEIRMCW